MKRNRRVKNVVLCLIMTLVLCSAFCLGVRADESLTVGMDQYRTENGKILIYVNHNRGSDFNPDTSESSVVVGKQSLAIETIEKFKDSGEPVSYMFVVDISGSMDKARIDTAKETLREFINAKKSGDNICIATMGDELVSTGFSEDAQVLNDFVDGIEVTHQDTDLYKSIREELNVLKTDKSVHQKRCLVIFSDGADDQKDGITQSEAETQVRDTHIPVFTVALLPDNYKDADLESAKILGSFARYSAGGVHYVPKIDEFECKEVCGKITKVIEDSLIVSADLADVTAQDGNIYLGVELSDGMEKGKDGMQIPVGDILDAIKEAQSVQVNVNINKNDGDAKVEEQTTQESTIAEPEPIDGSANMILVIVIAAVIIVIIVIIIIILISSNKKKETVSSGDNSALDRSEGSRTVGFGQGVPVPAPVAKSVENKPTGSVRIVLYKVGPGEEEKYPLVLNGRKTMGRKKTCDLSFENDNALSGIHCYLYSKDKKIYVQDNNSTNGTFVNGVPITGEYVVESGDILLAGSAEYRIVQE